MTDRKKLVLYTDGGFLLDSKEGGAGAHGYIYIGMSEKRQNVLSTWTPTPDGYVPRDETEESVDIINYVDIIKGLDHVTSSSESELNAINEALKWIETQDDKYESIKIYTDSQNIVSGITGWINNWKKSGWKTSTGKPVKFTELWQEVDERMIRIRKDSTLEFTWIKGHAGHVGNEKADDLANRGIILQKNNDPQTFAKLSDNRSYWNPPSSDRPPRLLDGPRMYVNTFADLKSNIEGNVTYYIGSHGAKDRAIDEVGKVYPCNYLSVLRLPTPDPVISEVTKLIYDIEKARGGVQGTLLTYNLQNLLSSRFYSEALNEGLTFTERISYPISLVSVTRQPLVDEIVPIGRAFRLVDYFKTVERVLDTIDDPKRIKRQSIIGDFFDVTKKKDGTEEYKIKSNITTATKTIKLDVEFSTSKKDLSEETFRQKLLLILGTDLPARNTLSALAKTIEVLDIISWRESSNSVRYGTYIKLTTGEEGVWTKYDSNLVIKK